MRHRPMRPFCRATTDRDGATHTCHKMLGHPGPHVCRYRQLGDTRPDVRWYSVAAEPGIRGVAL